MEFNGNFTWTEENITETIGGTTLEEQDGNTTYTEAGDILR